MVEEAAASTQHALIQKNPYFPDLLNQPDLLIVPELGRLVAIYVYAPGQQLTWRVVLPAIEDLFELKLASGESAVCIAIMDVEGGDDHLLQMMSNMFDLFVPIRDMNIEGTTRQLRDSLFDARPRGEHFELWKMEKKRVSQELLRFTEERYAMFVDERRNATLKPKELTSALRTAATTMDIRGLANHEFRVPTPKERLAGLQTRSQFVFDFGIQSGPESPTVVMDTVSLGRYGSRPKLRYLMTKARFTSYEPAEIPLGLAYRRVALRRVLLVDGNLAGPRHDPYRYVRALVSVGWEIEIAAPETLLRLANANV